MLSFNWSYVVRNWFARNIRKCEALRNSVRHRANEARQVSVERLEQRTLLSAISVTGTGDSINVDGFVTLSEAIASVNAGFNINADVTAVGAYGASDVIQFAIAGAGVHVISPTSPLPTIIKPVSIDGYSQAGASPNSLVKSDNAVLLIQIDGTLAGLESNGLVLGFGSAGSSVSGLVIAGFSGSQILVQSDGNSIHGNFVGTDVSGNAVASVTGGFGIEIDGTYRNVIGGLVPAARNVIGGNSDGIMLDAGSQSNLIQGNFIGSGADGISEVGNRLHGVALRGNGGLGIQGNEVGGVFVGAGNTIANNGAAGVAVFGDTESTYLNRGNTILGNSIYHNGLNNPLTISGIDLVGTTPYPIDDGSTLNDNLDGDVGPNLLQNFPVLTSATSDAISTTIVGSLQSNALTTYRIEFFASPLVSASGFGEGKTFLGSTSVVTDINGNVNFNASVGMAVPSGQFVTATATSGGFTTNAAPTGPEMVLGTAANFAVLGGSTVTITGATTLIGDVGVSPGSVIDGAFSTTGTIHTADAVAAQAQIDLTAGYNFLAGLPSSINLTGQELGGLTLTPGVYHFDSSAQLTGPTPLILNTLGDPHALFVFQIESTLTTASGVGSAVVVIGGSSDSIYWQVGSSATIGVGTQFVGNILAQASITLATGASLTSGRALARTGAVTLDTIVADSTTIVENNTSEFSAPVSTLMPIININDVTLVEGDSGTTNAVFTVSLSEASGQVVTVIATSADGTASFGSDYIALLPTTITFAPGETTQTVTVAVLGDNVVEANESFFINLSVPSNATLGDGQGEGTIVNDDVAIVSIARLTDGVEAALPVNGRFVVTQSAVSATDTTVNYAVSGTATTGSDFVALSGTVTILAGQTSANIDVSVLDDAIVEATETVVVTLTSLGAHDPSVTLDSIPANLAATVNITDAEIAIFSINNVAVSEGAGVLVFDLTVDKALDTDVTITVAFTDVTATGGGVDYVSVPQQITFLAGQTTKQVSVAIVNDALVEGDESFTAALSSSTPLGGRVIDVTDTGLGTINDSAVATVSVAHVADGAEAGVPVNGRFLVTLSAASATDTVVNYSVTGTASSGSDFTPLTGTVTILAGQTTANIDVPVLDDVVVEGTENVVITLTGFGAHDPSITLDLTPANLTATLDITDNDTGIFTINNVTVGEGDGVLVFDVVLDKALNTDVTITVAFTDVTATGGGIDYVSVPQQITFLAGQTTKQVSVAIIDDGLVEGDESFTAALSSVTPLAGRAIDVTDTGLGTIVDNELATVSVAHVSDGAEAGVPVSGRFIITLSAASATDTVVNYSVAGTATSGTDFTPLAGTATILAGQTTANIDVAVLDDFIVESTETVIVTLTGLGAHESGISLNATQANLTATVLVTDNDTSSLTISSPTVTEGDIGTTTMTFTVTSPNAVQGGFSVAFNVTDVSTNGADYTVVTASPLAFSGAAGETQTIAINVHGDTTLEQNESLTITLGAVLPVPPVSAASIVSGAIGTGVIVNDDSAFVTIAKINDGAELSTSANGKFRVTQSSVSLIDTVIIYSVSGTATPGIGLDYLPLSGTVTIPAGQLSADIDVAVLNDGLIEDTETVVVTLTGFAAHDPVVVLAVDPAGLTATVGITDSDSLVITSPATVSVAENTPVGSVILDVNPAPVSGRTFVYTLSGVDAALFSINSTTGEIRFATSPNYELPTDQDANNVYLVTVNISVDFTPARTTTQDLTIIVTPENDIDPVFVNASPTFTVNENSVIGTVVGTALATDGDLPPETLTYSIVAGNEAGAFSIDPATGQITVANSGLLNFENATPFTLTVRVTDNGSPSPRTADAIVVVSVINIEEGPFITIPRAEGIFHMGRIPAFVSPDSTFTYDDVANPDYSNAKLTVSIVTNRDRRDRINIYPKGNGVGQINVKGRAVFFGGTQIGTFSGGRGNVRPDFVVSFNSHATTSAVDNLMRRLNYHSAAKVGITRTVNLQVTNIGGVDSNLAFRNIAVIDIR